MFKKLAVLVAILAVLAVMLPASTAMGAGTRARSLSMERDFRAESVSSLVPAGYMNIPLASFILSAGNENVAVTMLVFRVVGSEHIAKLSIYHAGNLIKEFAVGGSSPQVIKLNFEDGVLSVPAGSFKAITVLGETYPMVSPLDNEVPIEVSLIGAMGTTPSQRVWDFHAVPGPTHRYFGSYPRFTINSATPSGTLTPSSNTLLAVFDITAVGTQSVTFQELDYVTFWITRSISKQTKTHMGFVLRDEYGIRLGDKLLVGIRENEADLAVEIYFGSSFGSFGELVVPAQQTRRIYLYGDTTDLDDLGDAIQVRLDDSSPGNLAWGINGIGPYHRADVIFRGDIVAGALQR
ncbi:MAG: hypothetical protein HY458_00140 [Parcubacteria group bacterium]|nr:hypothetical protein [Parcubacteria group bacterium]